MSSTTLDQPAGGSTRRTAASLVGWCCLALAIAFSLYVRIRLNSFPLERDEGEYAYAGQSILHGTPPYLLAYNMKLPGTYLAYAALMAIFGQTTAGIHAGLLVVNLLSIILLYRLSRLVFEPIAAGTASLTFSVLSVSPAVLGMAGHATHFVTLFAIAGALALYRTNQSARLASVLASGLLFGLAFLMKQQGVFLVGFGAAYLLYLAYGRHAIARRRLPLLLGAYTAGAVLPYLLICLWLGYAGVWSRFVFWTMTYASKYVQQVPLRYAPQFFAQASRAAIGDNWPLWLIAIGGAAFVLRRDPKQLARRFFVVAFCLFSMLCVLPGFLFRSHYYIVVLPAISMLAGAACGAIQNILAQRSVGPRTGTAAAVLPLACAVVAAVVLQRQFFFSWSPEEACARIYGTNPFIESPEVAAYIQKNTTANQSIAILGSEPEILFHSHRNSCTGYIYMYSLMERQPLARQMQEEMIREVEAAKPPYIVFVDVNTSWLPMNDEKLVFTWLVGYLSTEYRRVGVVDIRRDGPSQYRWDNEAEGYRRSPGRSVTVYRRKSDN